jgi:hypothetical protein
VCYLTTGKNFEGSGYVLIEVLTAEFSLRDMIKCNDEPQVRISGVPAWIRTEQLSNSSLDRYRYDNLLGRYLYQGILRCVGLTATNISKKPPDSIFRVKNIELAGSLICF